MKLGIMCHLSLEPFCTLNRISPIRESQNALKSKNSTDSGTISWKKQLGLGNHPCIFPPWNFFVSHQSEKKQINCFQALS
ncbi:hypothetical protein OIU79_003377 [Salix purpurea]|uniref:Uncharacterized protein n=1 Tax=Salix purpurea TaxID=77065 RepID=A0A9Q0ZF47_SALPP|nr:hypothetical protein OIU79_003377 [Salix purpurea]